MRCLVLVLAISTVSIAASGQTPSGPTDAKAQKTYSEGVHALKDRQYFDALDKFKKANKQDGGRCLACLKQIVYLAKQMGDFKAADSASRDLIAQASSPKEAAPFHYQRGVLLLQEGTSKHKESLFTEAGEEFKAALAVDPKDRSSLYAQGLVLARLKQDDAAKAIFEEAAELSQEGSVSRSRALRFAVPNWHGNPWRQPSP